MNEKSTVRLIGRILVVFMGVLVFMGQRGCNHITQNNHIQNNEDDKESQIPGKPLKVPVVPNKSNIVAEVLSIERNNFPQTFITLKILESKNADSFHNLLKPEETIKASPQYIYNFTEGMQQLIFTHPRNMQNFLAYYLLPTDRISAIAKAKSSNGKIIWSVTDIERITEQKAKIVIEFSPIPTPAMNNKSDIIAKVLKVWKKDFSEVDIIMNIIESRDAWGFF